MNKNTSNDFEKKTPDFLAIKNSSQSKNSFQINDLTQDQISEKSQFHEDLLVDHKITNNLEISRNLAINQEFEITPYQRALFKKRIFWQATIFALKIVIPVVIIAIILMQFTK